MEMSTKEEQMRRRSSLPGTEKLTRSGSSGSLANDEAPGGKRPTGGKKSWDFLQTDVVSDIIFEKIIPDEKGSNVYQIRLNLNVDDLGKVGPLSCPSHRNSQYLKFHSNTRKK